MDIKIPLSYLECGFSVIPTSRESKRPLYRWKRYKQERAKEAWVRRWWNENPTANLAIVCGCVSQGLQVIDFDHRADDVFPQWCDLLPEILFNKLPVVRTGKGYHVWFRVAAENVRPSTKLALSEERDVLVELKGEGGYIIAPPSWHQGANREYEWLAGKENLVPVLTALEVEGLIRAAERFDEYGMAQARRIKERAQRRQRNKKQSRGSNEGIEKVRNGLDMIAFAKANFGKQTENDSDDEVRFLGHGGLLINVEKNQWYCHADSMGGDPLDLVGYYLFKNAWTKYDPEMFVKALSEAASFAGVKL